MEKIWNKDEIKDLLLNSNKAVERGILAIYDYQTQDEKRRDTVSHNNGVGFNGFDCEILSNFAKTLLYGKHLTQKQMIVARKKMIKYAGQLTAIANAKKYNNNN